MLQKRASFLFSFIKMFPKLSKKGGVGGGGGATGLLALSVSLQNSPLVFYSLRVLHK